jgi:hypothetical protein
LFYAGERIDVKAFHPRLYTAGERLNHLRSQQAKDRWRQRRRDNVVQLLTANRFPHASRHYCTAVDGFVRNLFKLDGPRLRGRRWTAEDVVQICCTRHIT